MKIGQKLWTAPGGWVDIRQQEFTSTPQIVFVFGGRRLMEDPRYFNEISTFYPGSHILECSTAGEILDGRVRDDSIAVTAVLFEKSELHFVEAEICEPLCADVGKKIAEALPKENLIHAMVFCNGLHINGTALIKGLNDNLPLDVSVTGGLVGDGSLFQKTVLGLDHVAKEKRVVLVGFYGAKLKIGYGSLGGWDAFGIERTITKSKGNVLYELDGKPALDLYKTYLGDKADGLPSTGLLFPLRMRVEGDKENEVVRTILGINESERSVTFAGDMPQGAIVALMKANFDRLIDGASRAGNMSLEALGSQSPQLAILISCVGRKLVLKERTEEEVDAVKEVLGEQTAITGFYSYGELCPTVVTEKQCRLHNQTMTITTFSEDIN